MNPASTCKECGTTIPADSAGGWCPQCLLGLGLDEVREAESRAQNEKGGKEKTGQTGWDTKTSDLLPEGSVDRIGRYRLLKELGYGGCGVVYEAEQDQPVRRNVALKVIKLGMDTRQVVARFEAEKQALALMDHPSIAKVFDGGTIGDNDSQLSSRNPQLFAGRPYFVMELVSGTPITDYCNQNHLTTRQRLDLFIQVCNAIQHAHQKGIIHRDLKPSNVLVATQDGVPVPKVIDFGIAKAVQGRLTDETVFTGFEQFIGTPAYMSPEQAKMGGLDVDTRSDIYSLGVLLYELLTGKTPFDSKELAASGLEAMRRTIQEKMPPFPSTRVKQELAAHSSGPHNSAALTPQFALDKDLDWVVMKCLEKDRARRYETANGLGRDIERYLKNEPVIARPPSRLYTFRKAVERNRTAFVSAAIVMVALVSGIFVSTWQAVRAINAERRENQSLRQMQAIEIGRAEEYYVNSDRRNMLANLALVLRQNPTNRLAAERLMSALSHHIWARLACPPLVHTNRLTWAMFDKPGSRVLTTSADCTALIWGSASAQPLVKPLAHFAEINNADFSPDGRFVITASQDMTACVWNAETGAAVADPMRHTNKVSLAKFSPRGDLVLTVSSNLVTLWAANSSNVVHAFDFSQLVEDACFSPDGSKVAVACTDGSAVLCAVGSGERLHTLPHSKRVKCVSFSPDGKWVVTGSYDKSARVWDVQTGALVTERLLHEGTILSAEFSTDGQRIITTSADHTAQIWEAGTWTRIGAALTNSLDVRSGMFSPEGSRLVTTANQLARMWDAFSGLALSEPMIHEYGAYFAQFHPDGERVLTASNGKSALIWQIIGVPALTLFFPNEIESIEFSPDSKALVTASDGAHTRIWNPWTGKAITGPLSDRDNQRISRAVFSSDGKRVATVAPDDGTARIWNPSDGKQITEALQHGIGVSNVCFSPDGLRLLTSSRNRTCLWEADTGKLLFKREIGGLPDARSFSAGGEAFLGLIDPRTAQVFSTKTGEPLSPALSHNHDITSAVFSPDGQSLLTTAGENSLVIWEIKTGRQSKANFQYREPPFYAAYSPDGKHILGVTEKYLAQVWDIEKKSSLTGEFGGRFYIRHGFYSADGARIGLTFLDGSTQLLDANSGYRFTEPLLKGRNAIGARLSPDGRLLATSSKDEKNVSFWELPLVELPVPAWLPEVAEALAGQRFNSQGALVPVLPAELWTLQQKLAALPASGPEATSYTRWARWFVADVSSRTVLPSSTTTLPEYVQSLLEQGTPQSWRQALLLQPTNAVALARVGGSITNLGLADWMTRRAIDLAPSRTEVWGERAQVLLKQGKTDESNEATARSKTLKNRDN